MRFNVSRILVRVKQFFTRNRLVQVLGFTAILLFVLNFSSFLSYQFRGVPLISADSNETYFFSTPDESRSSFIFRRHSDRFFYENDFSSERTRCWKKRDHSRIYEEALEMKRQMKLRELELRLHEQKLQETIQHDHAQEREIIIKKLKESPEKIDVSITIDGEMIEVSKANADI